MLDKFARLPTAQDTGVIISGGLIAVAVFVVDLNLPLGVAGGVPYILPVLVLTFCSVRGYILAMGAVCSVLTIIGYLLSPPGGDLWVVLTNRGLAFFVIWTTAGFAFAYKRAAAKLAENEERYALAIDGTEDGLWDRDIASGEAYFSPRWFDILGYGEDELPANVETFYQLIHPDDLNRVRAGAQAHLDDGAPYDIELRMRHKDSHYIWVRTRGRAVCDQAGNPVRMAGAISDISKLKQMEIGLRESESRLNQGQRIARIGSWELDLTDNSLTWSDEIYRIFEIDPSRFGASYEAFLDAVHPDDRTKVNEAYTDSLSDRRSYRVTHRLRMRNGRIKWVEENCESDFDAGGKPLVSRGTVQDVTALTRAREETTRLREQFLDAIDQLKDQIGLYDSENRLVHFNHEFATSAGNGADRIVAGMSFEEVLRERIRAGRAPDAAKGREEDWLAERVRRFGGSSSIWEFERGAESFETREEKMANGGTMVIVSNVTARKQNQKALRESEARYRSLIEESSLGIHIGSMNRGRILTNRACAELFGFDSAEELIAIPDMALIAEHDKERITKRRTEMFEGRAFEPSYECDALRKDGSIIPVQVFVQRIMWDGEEAELRTFIDLTSRKQAEEQLRRAQRMEAVGQLTGGIAHEFNNLLMVIVGNLELTMARVTDAATLKFASSAMTGAMRGAELTNQLLAYSRKQDLRVERLNVNALVRGMLGILGRTLSETVAVNAELAEDIWPVLVDKSLLDNALLNLSLNARDAMPLGGKLVITTANKFVDAGSVAGRPDIAPGEYVLLEVADTGSGMAPEVVEKAFEPFFTTKDVGQGTGLGLSMVHGFVEQSGGFVEIESRVGAGARVGIYLPRAVEPAAKPDADIDGDAHVPSVSSVAPVDATILVVEDKSDVRETVVQILSELGYKIIEAENGRAALACLDRHTDIDVLFTDVVLPGDMSGPDIAVEARRGFPGLAVILTSGYPDGEVDEFPSSDEFPWFIRKPYRKFEIAALLVKALQSGRRIQALSD